MTLWSRILGWMGFSRPDTQRDHRVDQTRELREEVAREHDEIAARLRSLELRAAVRARQSGQVRRASG